jgi:hypothetical protein
MTTRNETTAARMTNKLAATKQAIVLLLESSGPCCIGQIINECQNQAYVGKAPQALNYLLASGAITYCPVSYTYESVI